MGSFFSSIMGLGEEESEHEGSSSSGVQSFHSSARWQLHFNSIKDSSQLMVIDFSASWCGPCRMIEPAVHALADKFTDVQFAKIDVDELSDVAREYSVQAMPTFVLVKKGKEVDRIVGARKDELERKVEKYRAI